MQQKVQITKAAAATTTTITECATECGALEATCETNETYQKPIESVESVEQPSNSGSSANGTVN